MEPGGSDDREPGKKRGRYKQYLIDPSIPIPRTTLISRLKQQNEHAEDPGAHAEDPGAACVNNPFRPRSDDENLGSDETHQSFDESEDSTVVQDTPDTRQDESLPPEPPQAENESPVADHRTKDEINYVEKYNLKDRLYQGLTVSKLDVLLMILHMAVRHSYTQHFIEDQIQFINTLFGEKVLDISWYIFKNLFKPSTFICKHYFCPECQLYLGPQEQFEENKKFVECAKCKKEIDVQSVSSGNYFITLSLQNQIQELLKKPNVKLIPLEDRSSDNGMADVFGGELYKNLARQHSTLHQDKSFLTVTCNTDGVSVHNSTKNSLWPIFFYINEVCPEERFKTENLILAGLWFGPSSPNMSLYLKPFNNAMIDLATNGVVLDQCDGNNDVCHVYPLLWSVDSVAKPKLLCQKQFNAYLGCLYCLHPNDSYVGNDKRQRYYDTLVSYPLRTEESVIKSMMEADLRQRQNLLKDGSVDGFIGISIMLMFQNLQCNSYNIVWSNVIDYLHCLLEGVAASLFGLLDVIFTPDDLKLINDRLSKITPPQAMTRRPRSFTERTYWKAKEYRAVLLYYILPLVEDLLPKPNYLNLKYFVSAVHILLSDKISTREMYQAKTDLDNFVVGFQRLYGLQNVTYNLHLCTHLVDLVIQAGPLWSYSNFVFESGNGMLVNLIKGTKTIINEIATKYSTIRLVSKFAMKNNISPAALKFCSELASFRYTNSHTVLDDIDFTGSHSSVIVTDEEQVMLIENNVQIFDKKATLYHRVIRKGIVYCSRSYTRSKVYDDSCVMLGNGTYAVIDKIVKSETQEVLCIIKPVRIAHGSDIVPAIKRCSYDAFDNVCIVPFKNIERKCMFVVVDDKNFICRIPNLYERD